LDFAHLGARAPGTSQFLGGYLTINRHVEEIAMSKPFSALLLVAGIACAAGAATPATAYPYHHGWHRHYGGWHGYYRHYGYRGYYGRPYYGYGGPYYGYYAGPPCIPVLGVVTGNFCNY
jgi:hypothetical protein